DQEIVVVDPISPRQDLPETELRLMGILGLHESQPVGDTMHVGVYTNPRFSITQCHHQIRGLAPYSFEFEKLIDLVGNLSPELRKKAATDLGDEPCLVAVKRHWIDDSFDFFGIQENHLPGVLRTGKEALRGGKGHFILGPKGEEATDENPKRSLFFREGDLA